MPFQNTQSIVEFRFRNPKDPLGERGLSPRSWNLEPDPENPGQMRFMQEGAPGESVWRFARFRTQADDDIIVRKTAKTNIRYDQKKARKQGRDYSPQFEQETLMSGLMALITTMSRGWSGPEFIVPQDYVDQNNKPSNSNGRLAPCTAYWIGQRDPVELRAVELFLQNLYEPEDETEESVNYFPPSDQSMDGPEGAGSYEAHAGDAGGNVPVPSLN